MSNTLAVDLFRQMLERQHKLQVETFKTSFVKMNAMPSERVEYVRWNVLALEDELHEALGEIDWKPWTNDEVFNRDAFLKELIDALHFWMNLVLVTMKVDESQTVEELAHEVYDLYINKAKVNADRQASGDYDGRSTKCLSCTRAVEDGERRPIRDVRLNNDEVDECYRCVCGRHNYLRVK